MMPKFHNIQNLLKHSNCTYTDTQFPILDHAHPFTL